MNALKKFGNKTNQFAIRWAEFITKFKWPVFLITVLMAMGIASQGKMEFDGDYHVFFTEANPELEAFDALQEKYTKDDNIILVLAPKNGDVFTRENLTAIEDLTAEAWNTPYSSRVDAVTNFQYTRAEEDDLYVDDLSYESSSKSDAEIKKIREVTKENPQIKVKIYQLATYTAESYDRFQRTGIWQAPPLQTCKEYFNLLLLMPSHTLT